MHAAEISAWTMASPRRPSLAILGLCWSAAMFGTAGSLRRETRQAGGYAGRLKLASSFRRGRDGWSCDSTRLAIRAYDREVVAQA